MKKSLCACMCIFILLCGLLTGCGSRPANDGNDTPQPSGNISTDTTSSANTDVLQPSGGVSTDTISIVTTIFPEYDWVREILGDNPADMELTLLMDNGADLHNFQPTVDDMVKISTCDLFIYVGGESDEWVPDALSTAVNQNITAISLLESLGDAVKAEELLPGMQDDDDDHDHDEPDDDDDDNDDHDDDYDDRYDDDDYDDDNDYDDDYDDGYDDHDDDDSNDYDDRYDDDQYDDYDEHVWLSLKNARTLCATIANALCTLDPQHAQLYRENLSAYQSRLDALDTRYQTLVNSAPLQTLLFGDRFPFRYLTDDYHLNCYAAFSGCSSETNASFETVVFLANKVDELNLPAVLTIENSDGRIARAIVDNTSARSAQILQMDSLQSVTARDVANGATYLGAMENNLNVLETALAVGN